MIYLLFSLLLSSHLSFAEIAKVTSIYGNGEATLIRHGKESKLNVDESLEKDDEIQTTASSVIVYLYPSGQIAVGHHSKIKLTESQISGDENEELVDSVINLLKGMLRLKIDRESHQKINQKVLASNAIFGVRGTDFELVLDTDDVDLDVYEGEVEVSSPDIQTFVPEIVKKNEGLRYSKREKKFQRRQFRARLKDAKFNSKQELKKKRQNRKIRKKQKRRS